MEDVPTTRERDTLLLPSDRTPGPQTAGPDPSRVSPIPDLVTLLDRSQTPHPDSLQPFLASAPFLAQKIQVNVLELQFTGYTNIECG